MIHHGFKKGKKVFVILNNGQELVGKFVESTSQYLILDIGKIKWANIRCTTINKQRVTDLGGR